MIPLWIKRNSDAKARVAGRVFNYGNPATYIRAVAGDLAPGSNR